MKQLMVSAQPLYERTERFRIYEHNVIPGLFQTAEYTTAMLTFWTEFLEARNDIEAAVAAQQSRQAVIYDGSKKFSVILEEAALRTWYGTRLTQAAQLDRLLSVMTLPNIAFGIVPLMTDRTAIGSTGFWIFDDVLVALETPTASIEITVPQEVALYVRMFDHLRQPAIYGRQARTLILSIAHELMEQHPAT
jgi:hypothetical protein